MDTIRVMLVDDHPLFRQGARCVLEQAGDCTVVAEASTGQAALELARAENPDVVLVDALLSSGDALESGEKSGVTSASSSIAISRKVRKTRLATIGRDKTLSLIRYAP